MDLSAPKDVEMDNRSLLCHEMGMMMFGIMAQFAPVLEIVSEVDGDGLFPKLSAEIARS